MTANDRVLAELKRLVEQGERVEGTKFKYELSDPMVDTTLYAEWVTSVLSLLGRVFGRDSDYYQHAIKYRDNPCGWAAHAEQVQGILAAAKADFEAGYFSDVRQLVAAEMFDDFLEGAEYLRSNGFYIPAASLAGAVLEDTLRRLHSKQIGQWTGESKISRLNDALHKAGVYPQPQWRQIQAWGDLRNDADHGNFQNISAADVERMIGGLRDFVTKYLC